MTSKRAAFALIAVCASARVIGAQSPAPSAPAAATRSTSDGVFTEAQAQRGKEVYFKHCIRCHGEALSGIDEAGPLTGAKFKGNWNGKAVGTVFARIRLTMPPGQPGTLTSQENADVVAYILQYNGQPTGETELPRVAASLKDIEIKLQAATPKPGSARRNP